MQQKIVLIGGPGTGKTTVLNVLKQEGYLCMPEISRSIILEAKRKGIEQLFLIDPLLFSKLLLEGREQQFLDAEKSVAKIIFFDRGIPDIHAYLNYSKTEFPSAFLEKSTLYRYNKVFLFSPWKEIYTPDNERYENFEQSTRIHLFLQQAYKELGYKIIQVPFGSAKERSHFIINSLSCDL